MFLIRQSQSQRNRDNDANYKNDPLPHFKAPQISHGDMPSQERLERLNFG